jgi:hypothetical protein
MRETEFGVKIPQKRFGHSSLSLHSERFTVKKKVFLSEMEFPSNLDCFEAADFEVAVPRSTGRILMELMAQIRPTGRVMDHYRITLGGSAMLETNIILSSLFPDPSLAEYKLNYQVWAKDVSIRRNMTTGKWMDVLSLITSNAVMITDLDGNPVNELKRLLTKELLSTRASLRHAVVIGPDQRMALELQSLPASEAVLTSKPAFVG